MLGSTLSPEITSVEPAATVTTPSALKATPPPLAVTVPLPVIATVSTVERLALSDTPPVASSCAVTARLVERVLRSAAGVVARAVTVTALPEPVTAVSRSASAAVRESEAVSARVTVVTLLVKSAAASTVTRLSPEICRVSIVERLAARVLADVALSCAVLAMPVATPLRSAARVFSSAVIVTEPLPPAAVPPMVMPSACAAVRVSALPLTTSKAETLSAI